MQYRPLGKTGLNVSVIGFGCGPLGDMYDALEPDKGRRAVHAAIERGVNFFDTSPYYGPYTSEERLGEHLVGRRHQVVLATKCGRYGRDLPDGFDFSAQGLRRSVEDSLRRLKTEYIDLCQLHDIEFEHESLIVNESLPALYDLRAEGKIRFVGITGYPVHLLESVARQRDVDTVLSYCHYNLLTTMLMASLVPYARSRGIGVINASALHMGVLTEQGQQPWHPAPKPVLAAARQAVEVARKHGTTITHVALTWALQDPRVDSTLVGMGTEAEVHQNLDLIGQTPAAEALAAIQEILAPVQDMSWPSGLPEHYEPNVHV